MGGGHEMAKRAFGEKMSFFEKTTRKKLDYLR